MSSPIEFHNSTLFPTLTVHPGVSRNFPYGPVYDLRGLASNYYTFPSLQFLLIPAWTFCSFSASLLRCSTRIISSSQSSVADSVAISHCRRLSRSRQAISVSASSPTISRANVAETGCISEAYQLIQQEDKSHLAIS